MNYSNTSFTVVPPWLKLDNLIELMLSHSDIISSSLHGIIVAHSFGLDPKICLFDNQENPFKYADYLDSLKIDHYKLSHNENCI